MCDSVKVSTAEEELKWGVGGYVYPAAVAACWGRGGCCVRGGRKRGGTESLNTLQKQTRQSSMAYLDAFTMKATRNSSYEATV